MSSSRGRCKQRVMAQCCGAYSAIPAETPAQFTSRLCRSSLLRKPGFSLWLEPLLPSEERDEAHCDNQHEDERGRITIIGLQLRHIPWRALGVEIHAPHADDEGERDENRRNDRQDADDF